MEFLFGGIVIRLQKAENDDPFRTMISKASCLWMVTSMNSGSLIVWCVILFSTGFQLYWGSQCTYPCFPEVLLTSTLSKQLAAFPLNNCQNRKTQDKFKKNYFFTIYIPNCNVPGKKTFQNNFRKGERSFKKPSFLRVVETQDCIVNS